MTRNFNAGMTAEEGGALAPDPEWEPNDLERYHCARCGCLLERAWYSVYVPPFQQVLLACSDDCAHVLRVTMGEVE